MKPLDDADRQMPPGSPSDKPASIGTWLRHVLLVIMGVGAAMMIAYSPSPAIGAIVLALVLGVEVPAAWRHHTGGTG